MDGLQKQNQIAANLKRKYEQEENESEYSPQIGKNYSKRVKKTGKKLQKNKKANFNCSTWTLQENVLYKDFLKKYAYLFDLEREQRRAIKINIMISKFVKTRTSDQCRSHHQKMLIHHTNIPTIIQHIQFLETKKEDPKMGQSIQAEQPQTINFPSVQMKEIGEDNKLSPSLWDSIVDEVLFTK